MPKLRIELANGRSYEFPYDSYDEARDVMEAILRRIAQHAGSWEAFIGARNTPAIAINTAHVASMEVEP